MVACLNIDFLIFLAGKAALFDEPKGVFADELSGKAWVCDTKNNLIRVISLDNEFVSTLRLNGVPH